MLLATVIEAAVNQAGYRPRDVGRVLVACDTGVGAQDLNLARRAALELGWDEVAGITVDGQGVGDLTCVGLAASWPGVTVVAAVDVTSVVPPGAGLVRDYGRPTLSEPDLIWLEAVAQTAGFDAARLDAAAARLRSVGAPSGPGIVAVSVGTSTVEADAGVPIDAAAADLEPLSGPGGLLTAAHEAPLADGAAAIVIEHGRPTRPSARLLRSSELVAGPTATILERLSAPTDSLTLLGDASVVIHEVIGLEVASGVSSVPAVGSTPSADGLRLLVDAFHATESSCRIVRRGRHGQTCVVEIGETPAAGATADRAAYPD